MRVNRVIYTNIKKTSNTIFFEFSSQISGVKVIDRKGNSPDYSLRSLNFFKYGRLLIGSYNQKVGLESAILLGNRNRSLF